ncbi:nicastrin isoform X2 [Olea europaea subsp. europaea]|uniref:Nicastrin n=3 Tax=Olea europaea subsp. europaea TaxID=158383 RepID=A0A8S0V6P8_OLEEU|nr:nicastrin isoform X2 [Olea europaea subsp. europaea]
MATVTSLLLFVLCASFGLSFSDSGQENSFESVPDLEKSMYMHVDGYPCVRVLNLSGEIGCSNPSREKVVAPIVRYKSADELLKSAAVLVSIDEFEILLSRLSKDLDFAGKVAGILVESRTEVSNGLKGFSPDGKFPQAEFAPYQSNNFTWNPPGSGIMWKAYNFPVFLLSRTSTLILQEVVMKNEKTKKSNTENVAEFNVVMQTTKSGTHDSDSCLKEETCLPLGGYSVWSALPPINISSSQKSKPVIVTMTSMDSASFFRDKSLGADSPISGLITLLAAVDALSYLDGLDELNKQLVFVVLTGESWGYLGTRRFVLEADQHSDSVRGLDFAMIETVMEIGSVGKGLSNGVKTFYSHTSGDTLATNETFQALLRAQDSLKTESIKISMASTSNPGVPPSSLMTFLRKKSQISGVVLEDFDTSFTNKFYHSHLDDLSNVNSSAIVTAASLVARTLYLLANDQNASAINAINVNASLVEELLGCLLNCKPGSSCELMKHYISPSATCPSHYVGVILGEPSSVPYPAYVSDVSRFVWNFLASKTSIFSRNITSACPNDCNGVGELCIREEADGKGICVISTTRYVPAYSTRLKYESGSWTVLPYNSSEEMSAADPVWTESNWDTISLRVYKVQNTAYDGLILLSGIVVTVLTYLLILITRAFIRKALKWD